jgi:uncharacterized damage-inducible protein DinB
MKKALMIAAAAALAGLAGAQPPAAAPAAPAKPSTFRSEFLAQQDGVEKYILSLAEAVPAEKYGWRPGEGVRSVGEVYMHIAGGNSFLLTFAGAKAPAGEDPSAEKTVTDKAQIIDALKKSFAHLRQVLASTSDTDLDKPVKLFGRDSSVRGVFLVVATHEHEHLGQSIAYARMNGIVPPWTEERQKKAAEKAKASPEKK